MSDADTMGIEPDEIAALEQEELRRLEELRPELQHDESRYHPDHDAHLYIEESA